MEGKVELSKLKDALGKASKLMSMDKNGTISKIAESKRDSINTSLNDSTVSTESMMTARPQRNMTEVPRNVIILQESNRHVYDWLHRWQFKLSVGYYRDTRAS